MREIRFRIWDTKTKRYLEKGHPDFVNAWGFEDCKNRLVLKAKSGSLIFEQYTGLKDKDGKEINEGDIVLLTDYHIEVRGVMVCLKTDVRWDREYCGFILGCTKFGNKLPLCSRNDYVVVGNIHENPELLEAKL